MCMHRAILWLGLFVVRASSAWAQSGESAQEAFAHAVDLHRAGDFSGAINEYRVALALDPSNVEARSNLGAALAHLGHYEEAIDTYRQALQNFPAAASIHLRMNLALAYYKSGKTAEAARELEEVRQQVPGDLQATMLTADCYLRLGELERVIALLSPISVAHPGDRAIDYMLGMALIRSGQVDKGQALVENILHDRDSAEAHFLLGSAAFMAKDYPDAVKEFAKAVAINSGLPSLESYYGQALLFSGDPDGAAAAFRGQLTSDPNDYESNLRLAEILLQRGQFTEARPLFERALEVRPDSAEAGCGIAKLDLAAQQPGRARLRLEGIVAHRPDYADAHRTLAIADEQLMRKQEATQERVLAAKLEGGSGTGGLPLGSPAPDFTLLTPSGDHRVHLSDFRDKSPVVLILASYSCPKFRSQVGALNALYARYHGQAEFLFVYIREAHSSGAWQSTINQREAIDLPDTRSFDQRCEYASSCVRKLKIPFGVVVDSMDNVTEKAYTGWPSRLYVVDKRGRVIFNSLLDELNFNVATFESTLQSANAPQASLN
jgi:tetratricopeptide (TPR) repeat protein